MMTDGATTEEREAAARALVRWPPPAPYRFRLAEWGVFNIDASGATRVMEEQLAEVPPFVHRTGDAAASFLPRMREGMWMIAINKPVLHLTSDVPLAASIEVGIAQGRPLVAYPKPDDFLLMPKLTQEEFQNTMGGRMWGELKGGLPAARGGNAEAIEALEQYRPPNVSTLDNPKVATFDDPREGYSWLSPRHRVVPFYQFPPPGKSMYPATQAVARVDDLRGVGLRWQSLIVSPAKLAWMTDAAVPADPRFAWWERLRRVECSYVSSRGESERFVYYDGPSMGPAPVTAVYRDGTLFWRRVIATPPGAARAVAASRGQQSMYVEREGGGNVRAIVLPDGKADGPGGDEFKLAGVARIDGAAAEAWLLEKLKLHGLSEGEAMGLIDCWRERFFKSPGRRVLTIASGADYEAVCPMTVRPPPTEMARVAVFWNELSEAKAARKAGAR
jgi:hypothetical protein